MTSPPDPRHGPQAPAAPPLGPPSEPAPPPARPGTVVAAFWLAVLAPLLVTALHAVGSVLARGFLADAVGADDPEVAAAVAGIGAVVFVVAVLVMVALTALWIAFGFALRAGRGWARVVLSTFAGIWVFYSVGGLVTGEPALAVPAGVVALGHAQNAVGLLAMLAFLVLVRLPASNRYFRPAGSGR
ncbi:hypothetical protein [Saccharopolyspora sp. 7B]|uniref:hypothetical protein n=1 Tax=Saccharopolyspora sp. 7B TaxID=2877240 RepID=UPI001CD4249A|nr:hypothetical protein [Saccharopolyspora sp. 7B]MCA1278719.1 hypothetical protein [Saccharopolyspora sp. 7B]